jgi:hypothetical protein
MQLANIYFIKSSCDRNIVCTNDSNNIGYLITWQFEIKNIFTSLNLGIFIE